MQRVHPAPEPTLKIHRYIVALFPTGKKQCLRYCVNRAEVREVKNKQKPGTYIQVFKADHNFTAAWLA